MTDPLAGLEALDALQGYRVLEAVTRGPLADAWLLERGDERAVLRRDRPLAGRLGLDRVAEWGFLRQAFDAGLGPEPLFHDPGHGVLLTRFLPGVAWDQAAAGSATTNWVELGRLLRRVHDLPGVTGKRFDLAAIAAHYARAAGTSEADRLARRVGRLAVPLYVDAPWCLCHHDAHRGNVVGAAPPRLLDWEYAALGHPLFDLAVVIRFHALDEAAGAQFLSGWAGEGEWPDPDRLDAFCRLYDTVAALWALAVDPAST